MESKNIFLIIIVGLTILICCLCIILVASGIFLIANSDTSSLPPISIFPDEQENNPQNNFPFSNNNSLRTPQPNDSELLPSMISPFSPEAYETYETLKNTYIPENDPYDLARRLKGIDFIPDTVPNIIDYQIGDEKEFWVTNVDTNENRKVKAKLGFKTDNIYFWIEDSVSYDKNELEKLVFTFENNILPTNRDFFGTEWIPGIDENERLFVLYATNLGSSLAGYFSSADALPPQIHEFSNAHEMFMLNADTIRLSQKFTYGVLAHEYQHMIHWYQDRNEKSWLNEGFSELAAFINGYYESGFDSIYMANTDIQLNDWPNNSFNTTPHYGASFLFVNYFLNRFGEDATKILVRNPENGLDSIDNVLTQINARDNMSGEILTADDIFSDWIITNFVMDKRIDDGKYHYENYTFSPRATLTENIDECEFDWKERTVTQYGADYIELKCNRDFNLHFQGISTTNVIPEFAFSGDYALWSNKGDESNMVISQTFDFSEVNNPVTMSFMMWYDIEKDYDYLYLTSSVDGQNWQILETPSCIKDNPTGNSYGCGFNGKSPGWVKEEVDLSQFAGKSVEIRFEYVTDAAVYGEGFLLDDIQIPEIGYFSDFEVDHGGWKVEGWARINNQLPQTYRVILLEYNSGKVKISELELSDIQGTEILINGKTNNKTILIVSGTTRYTRQPAFYQFKASR